MDRAVGRVSGARHRRCTSIAATVVVCDAAVGGDGSSDLLCGGLLFAARSCYRDAVAVLEWRNVSLQRGWDVAAGRAVLVAGAVVHGEHPRPDAVTVSLRPKEATVAALAVDLVLMVGDGAAVDLLVAVPALDAHLVVGLAQHYLLLGEVHLFLTAGTLAGHCGGGGMSFASGTRYHFRLAGHTNQFYE